MITTKSKNANYLTEFTDGMHVGECDAPTDKGGKDVGFTPFALLEASLAGCLNITMRVFAESHGIALDFVETKVSLKPGEDGSVFEYSAKLPDNLGDKDKKRLLAAMKACPIHGLLGRPLSFVQKEG